MARRRLLAAILVLSGLALSGWLVGGQVRFRADVGVFLPRSASADMTFVVDRLRDSPAGNILLVGLSGAPEPALVSASDRLADRLRKTGRFRLVANGRPRFDEADVEVLVAYRYLLGPPIERGAFSPEALRRGLERTLRSLETSAFFLLKRLLPRDPTGRTMQVALSLARRYGPERRRGIWFSDDGKTALMLLRTEASALDLAGQQEAVAAVQEAVRQLPRAAQLRVDMSGPGAFAVAIRDRVRGETWWLGLAASVSVLLLLVLAFRSIPVVLLLTIPLVGGLIAGVAAVQLLFGNVHGITLTFGATLMGIAIDYPVHHATHTSLKADPWETAARIWPTLRLSMATTVAGFLPLTLSSFPGLAQLGLICIAGLFVAALLTRWVLPAVLGGVARAPGPAVFGAASRRLPSLRRLRPAALMLCVVLAAVVGLLSGYTWENDLGRLSPMPEKMRELDRRLRTQMRAPGPRYLLVVRGATADAVLERSEDLMPGLDRLVKTGKIAGYETPAQILPSDQAQRARQALLPRPDVLRRNLQTAQRGLPFRPGTFEPFLRDVEAARRREPIGIGDLGASSLGSHMRTMLFRRGADWAGLVVPSGVEDPAALQGLAAAHGQKVRLLDLKAAAEGLVAGYRSEALKLVAAGALVAVILLFALLRRGREVVQVCAPVILSIALSASVIALLGIKLSIFHLLALLVVAGIGLDYALFLRRETATPERREKTVRSILVCSATTILVFGILSVSALPVLHGIGLTVAIGAATALVMASVFCGTNAPGPSDSDQK